LWERTVRTRGGEKGQVARPEKKKKRVTLGGGRKRGEKGD